MAKKDFAKIEDFLVELFCTVHMYEKKTDKKP